MDPHMCKGGSGYNVSAISVSRTGGASTHAGRSTRGIAHNSWRARAYCRAGVIFIGKKRFFIIITRGEENDNTTHKQISRLSARQILMAGVPEIFIIPMVDFAPLDVFPYAFGSAAGDKGEAPHIS
jgi:hypothetical protein